MPRQKDASKRLILGITGQMGAGKTSAGRYLKEKLSFEYVRYSQVLKDWKAEGKTPKEKLQAIGWVVMSGGKQAELNARLISRIGTKGDYVVDGLRHPIDYKSLASTFGQQFRLLYLESSSELRWKRLQTPTRFPTFADFQDADQHLVEQQIVKLKPKADAVISNDGTEAELHAKVANASEKFRQGAGK